MHTFHLRLFSFRLTVEEHVWFYGCLKGLSEAEVKSELDTLLDNVGLLHKRHEQTKNLSGKFHRCLIEHLTEPFTASSLCVRWHAEEAVCGNSIRRRF